MDKESSEKEIRTESQLVMICAYTVLTVALMAATIYLKWETWIVPLLGIAVFSVWGLHLTQGLTEKLRMYNTVILIQLEFFFYCTHSTSFFDMPITLILILLLFVTTDDLISLYLTVFTYAIVLAYHFAIIHSVSFDTTNLEQSRIGLDLIAGLISFLLTRYLIKRRKQEQLNYSKVIEELEETTRRAEDFLTNVSHELRTPINAVTGMSDIMLRNEENEEKRKDLIAIQQAGRRLFNQISDILDYTELDTGRLKLSSEPYMISSTINDLITEMQFTLNRTDLELIIDIDPQIPSMLIGDEGKIKKIIWHLTDNAFKFTKSGGVYIHVYTLKKDYGVNLCICVQDTGIGITDEKIDTLYEKFYQADAGRSRRAGGMGLGLSIVHGLVQELGGFLFIKGTEGKGSQVHISIPQELADETPCMAIEKDERMCIAVYTQPKKFEVPAVREFYDTAIENLRKGMGISLYRVSALSELQKLQHAYSLTHVYIGEREYEEAAHYFEELGKTACVIVLARENFMPRKDSRIIVTHKPFNGFPLTNILANGSKVYMRDVFFAEKRMICPKVRALVVDDDEMNLLVASGILKDYKMNVTTARSGMEAISLCEANSFDIVFIDHMMPEMDGIETMHRLKQLVRYSDESMVIIALTANAVSGAREMFLQEGFDEFVAKPIEPTVFERVMRKVLPASCVQFVAKEAVKQQRYTSPFSHWQKTTALIQSDQAARDTDLLAFLDDAGVNVMTALQFCREDRHFFLDLIRRFAQDAQKKSDEIQAHFDSEEWHSYEIKVHALKSASKTVGLDSLSRDAELLEKAAKKLEIDFVRENTPSLLKAYGEITKKINDIFKPHAEKQKAEDEAAHADSPATKGKTAHRQKQPDGDWRQWLEKLTALEKALQAYESDKSEAAVKELFTMSLNGKSGKDMLSEVEAFIQDFDFTPAISIVSALIDEIRKTQGDAK